MQNRSFWRQVFCLLFITKAPALRLGIEGGAIKHLINICQIKEKMKFS